MWCDIDGTFAIREVHRVVEVAPETLVDYLTQRGVLTPDTPHRVDSLGGGVSNRVFRVQWDDHCTVVKQPLPNLDVEDDWPADLRRVHNEAAAARAYNRVIQVRSIDRAGVPGIQFEDEESHVIGMDCAPSDSVMWKRQLLEGEVDPEVAEIAGRLLGEVHLHSRGDSALRETFASKRPFEQLRLDPYHRTTASRHPEVAEPIQRETERIRSVNRTLVHGDYSPKNVLVEENEGVLDRIWILDFEVAHWGDPAFDAAFMLNHLLIKSVYNHSIHERYIEAGRRFWTLYSELVPWDLEEETVTELAVLMLARMDGKSPVEYVEEGPVARVLRAAALDALDRSVRRFEDYLELLNRGRRTLSRERD